MTMRLRGGRGYAPQSDGWERGRGGRGRGDAGAEDIDRGCRKAKKLKS